MMAQTVSVPVLSSNYPSSHTIRTRLFGHKNITHLNAKIGLRANNLRRKVVLIVVHPLIIHITLDSRRHQHVHPQRYDLKTV
jgi:hypothetical protein